jgi:hypothetical protein
VVNEVLQWVAVLIVGFFLVGVLRQLDLMLPARVKAGSGGPELGAKLPRTLLEAVRTSVGREGLRRGVLLAFVTENCVGCRQLLGNLRGTHTTVGQPPLALIARAPSRQFASALDDLGFPIIRDDDGRLSRAASVTATPLVVRIDESGRVMAKEVTHRVDVMASSIS